MKARARTEGQYLVIDDPGGDYGLSDAGFLFDSYWNPGEGADDPITAFLSEAYDANGLVGWINQYGNPFGWGDDPLLVGFEYTPGEGVARLRLRHAEVLSECNVLRALLDAGNAVSGGNRDWQSAVRTLLEASGDFMAFMSLESNPRGGGFITPEMSEWADLTEHLRLGLEDEGSLWHDDNSPIGHARDAVVTGLLPRVQRVGMRLITELDDTDSVLALGYGAGSVFDGFFAVVAQSLSGGKSPLTGSEPPRILRCANETCERYFLPSHGRQKYHNPKCANAQKVREYRRRQKREG